MHPLFEELDYCPTPIGAVSLRRRMELVLKRVVYEIKLDDEFLMSSLFTASEEALAWLGIAACKGNALDVIVGGLGLGYTAKAVLEHDNVASLGVVEMLVPVIDQRPQVFVCAQATIHRPIVDRVVAVRG